MKHPTLLRGCCRALALLACAFAVQAADDLPADVLARLGKLELKAADVQALLAITGGKPGKPEQVRQALAGELIRRTLLKEARDAGWEKKPEISTQIERAREQVVVATWLQQNTRPDDAYPGDDEVAKAYAESKASLTIPKQFRIAQIFIASPPDGSKEVQEKARDKAKDLARRASAKDADFAELAKANSDETRSAAQGGDAGWVTEQTLLPELRAKVTAMKKNEVVGPIKSTQGWHVLRLAEVREKRTLGLDEARASLVGALRKQKAKENEQAYLRSLAEKAGLQFNEAALKKLQETGD